MGPATAQVLHSRIADVLEEEGQPRRLAALFWEAARHRALAGEPERAIALLEDCAEHLMSIGLPEEAAETFGRAGEFCRTDEERLRCLRGKIRALDAAGRWDSFDKLIPSARNLAVRLEPAHDLHDDLELKSTELLWRLEIDPLECRRRAQVCSELASAAIEHRLRALRIRAIVTDNLCDYADLERTHLLAMRLTTGRPEYRALRLTVDVIYNTALGDLDLAVDCCRELIEYDSRRGALIAQCRSLRFVTYPLRIIGEFDKCRENLRESLRVAERYRFAAEATQSCDILATISIEQNKLDDASVWVERAAYWSKKVDASLDRFAAKLLQAQLALANGDARTVIQVLGGDVDGLVTNPIPRVTLNVLSTLTCAYLKLNRRRDIVRAIPILRSRLELTIGRGRQDDFVRTLSLALRYTGKNEEARNVIRSYVSVHRRDRSPIPADLLTLQDSE